MAYAELDIGFAPRLYAQWYPLRFRPAPMSNFPVNRPGSDQPPSSSFVTGREPTLAAPATAPLSGREPTLDTPAGGVSEGERTMETQAAATPFVSGREATLATPPAERPASQALGVPNATPMTPAAGASDRPRAGGTSGFDEDWYLHAGRTGNFSGQTWGDFSLGGMLGEGGMGAVYRAWQRSLKRRVALKVLPSNMSANPRLLSRFRLEATAASKLQSTHVVQVYAIGEHDGHHYYAMEYVEGKDLHDLIKERREAQNPITPTEAADYILQAARGLVEASAKGIVHRDIKPPNLLVTTDGVVKIADFGIVKVLGERHVTMTGQTVGTPAYVSPEQGRGDRSMDGRSDLYSLGVVFYELACGVRPFDGNTPNALIYQHCYEEPSLPRALNSAIPPEIQAVILRCLQKKPESRYQSASELVRDLEGIRSGQLLKSAIAHYQLTTGAKEAKREQMNWLQRQLLPVAAAALVVIAGGVGGGWWIVDRNQKDAMARERQSLVGEKAVADQRTALAAALDAVLPIAEDIDDQLVSFAKRSPAGEQDQDLLRWRAKVVSVRELETRLAPLSSGTADSATRRAGRADLDALITKVGPGVPAAERAKSRLDALDAEEARLRIVCAQIDTAALRLSERRRFGDQLTTLTALAAADDPHLVKWKNRLTTFDTKLAVLRARIASLDEAKQITIAERNRFLPVLTELRAYLDDTDTDLLRWRDKLEGADRRITQLREDIVAIVGPQPERIPKAKQAQIADKLADLVSLVGTDDPQVKDWQNAIAGTDRSIAGARQRLAERAKDSADGIIPQPAHVAFERDVALLATLAAEGDTEHLTYEQQLVESRRHLDGLHTDCLVLEPASTNPITFAEQKTLGIKVERLATKGALDQERAQRYRDRLAIEAGRITNLRTSLSVLDQAAPLTSTLDANLNRLIIDVGKGDSDVIRWSTKRDQIRALQNLLATIDRREGIPEHVEGKFAELAILVGDQDPLLQGWRKKVIRITEAHSTLRVLDRRETYDDSEVRRRLADLTELTGTDDQAVQTWQDKIDEVARLKVALRPLHQALTLSQKDHAVARERLERLSEILVGTTDPEVRQASARLRELEGPYRPSWASDMGRDVHGLWVDAKVPGGTMRFRFIAAGAFLMGDASIGSDRKSDEMPFKATLPNAFWIADSETSRSVWSAIMGTDPSWTPLFDAAVQPVERMSWDDAQAFCLALGKTVSGMTARLPMEPEWEYACRAGSTEPWDVPEGMSISPGTISKIAWHHGNTGEGAQASRSRLPNRLGLYDMHGNLHEWCADGYGPYPTTDTILSEPANGTSQRVLRGGSWGDRWEKNGGCKRTNAAPSLCSAYVGVRIVITSPRHDDAMTDGSPRRQPIIYHIKEGDRFPELAMRLLGTEGERLVLAANPWLADQAVPPTGASLIIPPAQWRVHQVLEGEILALIARQYGENTLSATDILAANPWIGVNREPVPGCTLLIPVRQPMPTIK